MNPKEMNKNISGKILPPGSAIIHVGLAVFEEALKVQGVRVIPVKITPAYNIAPDLKTILDNLI